MFRFTIRDLLWLMVVMALAAAWWNQFMHSERTLGRQIRTSLRLNWLVIHLHEHGYAVGWDDRANSVTISPPLVRRGGQTIPPNPSAPVSETPSE